MEDPEALKKLETFLFRSGLTAADEIRGGLGWQREYSGTPLSVLVGSDRGSAYIQFSGMGEWWDLRVVFILLDGVDVRHPPTATEVEMTVTRWPELIAAFGSTRAAQTEAELRRIAAALEQQTLRELGF